MAHKPFYKLRLKATQTFGINKNWELNVLLVVVVVSSQIFTVFIGIAENITYARIHEHNTHAHAIHCRKTDRYFKCRYSVLLLLLAREREEGRAREKSIFTLHACVPCWCYYCYYYYFCCNWHTIIIASLEFTLKQLYALIKEATSRQLLSTRFICVGITQQME